MMSTLSIICLSLSGLLFLFATWSFYHAIRLKRVGKKTFATIIDHRKESSGGDTYGYVYVPLMEFETEAGERVQGRVFLAKDNKYLQVGQKIEILYDANNPKNCRENTFMAFYFAPLILVLMVAVFGAVGMVG